MVRDPSAKPIRNTTKAHPRVSVAMCISHLIDVASVVNNKDNNYPFHHICTLCKSPKCVLRLLVYNPRDHPSLCEDDFVPPSIKQQYPTTNKMRCWWWIWVYRHRRCRCQGVRRDVGGVRELKDRKTQAYFQESEDERKGEVMVNQRALPWIPNA